MNSDLLSYSVFLPSVLSVTLWLILFFRPGASGPKLNENRVFRRGFPLHPPPRLEE
jgi:hypothetical protein